MAMLEIKYSAFMAFRSITIEDIVMVPTIYL